MKKTTLYLLLVMVLISLLGACAAPVSNTAEPSAAPSVVLESVSPSAAEPLISGTPAPTETAPEATPSASQPGNDIAEKTKEFLMHGQEDKPEAGKLLWAQEFLDQVDISAVYEQYIADGGKADDVTAFAEYLTENAPVPDNWKELFEADLLAQYDMTPTKYEDLGDNHYQVYVMNEGKEVPYVAVNARTGYFHG